MMRDGARWLIVFTVLFSSSAPAVASEGERDAGWNYGTDKLLGPEDKGECYLDGASDDFIEGCIQSIEDGYFDPYD